MKEAKRVTRPSRARRTAGALRFTARLDGAEPDPAEGVKAEDMPGAQSSALPLPQSVECGSVEPKAQGATTMAEAPALDVEEDARFADACVLPDGTVREYGGKLRTWPSVEAFHTARGWRAAALFFPACPRPQAAK